jgi:hypothetical protein
VILSPALWRGSLWGWFVKNLRSGVRRRICPVFWNATGFIVLADVTMSTGNILAVAAIAQGDFFLLLFGLGLSNSPVSAQSRPRVTPQNAGPF